MWLNKQNEREKSKLERVLGIKGISGEDTTQLGVGGGGEGFGGGPAWGEGTLEYRTLGGVIPHHGGARGSAGLDPKRRGGPLLKYASRS
jgi:hypothetical protein